MTTRSQDKAADVAALLRARNPVLWINTREEVRAELYIAQACQSAGYMPYFWDCAQGATKLDGSNAGGDSDPGLMLRDIRERAKAGGERAVWVMRDLHRWLDGPIGIATCRQLRNLARELPALGHSIIILSPTGTITPELEGDVVALDWPLPDRAEVAALLDSMATRYKCELNGKRDAAIDAAVGLTSSEAEASFAKSIVQTKTIDPAAVAAEKKAIIAKSGVLEWLDPLPGGLASVGGLDAVKAWVGKRAMAFTAAAREYGLPAPKGILLVGISGCGKSFTPKALATEWRCPLIRFDFGALKGKFVGQSEGNLRKALATIDSLGRCIVLVDEIEKALAGATQGAADGGVSADALGTFLSWMNDRTSQAFVVATANDISSITQNAPELLRKGRFDELFFVDLPSRIERGQILAATLRTFKREVAGLDMVVDATADFTGAELAAIVPEGMFAAFADGVRELTADDLIEAAKSVVPLADTAKEKIASLRNWAKTRARLATTPDAKAQSNVRALDI